MHFVYYCYILPNAVLCIFLREKSREPKTTAIVIRLWPKNWTKIHWIRKTCHSWSTYFTIVLPKSILLVSFTSFMNSELIWATRISTESTPRQNLCWFFLVTDGVYRVVSEKMTRTIARQSSNTILVHTKITWSFQVHSSVIRMTWVLPCSLQENN